MPSPSADAVSTAPVPAAASAGALPPSASVASAEPFAPAGSFVLGDSISLSPWVGPVLGGYGYPVVGKVGQTASERYLREHLSGAIAQAAPAWVLILGANNFGTPEDVARIPAMIGQIAALRTDQQVFWVLPYRPSTFSAAPGRATLDAFNAELARQAALNPWLTLLDFAGTARLNEQWYAEDGQHLHPDQQGQEFLVSLIVGPSPTPAPTRLFPSNAAPTPSAASEPPVFDNEDQPAEPFAPASPTAASPEMPASPAPSPTS